MTNLLSQLPKLIQKRKKRLGRGLGSTKGAKSSRGTTRHQRAREKIPLHFEGGQGRLVKKFPLLRGKGKNKSRQKNPYRLFLSDLNKFKQNETVDIASIIKIGLVAEDARVRGVKILNKGKLERKLTVKVPVSLTVFKAIEKVGGTILN